MAFSLPSSSLLLRFAPAPAGTNALRLIAELRGLPLPLPCFRSFASLVLRVFSSFPFLASWCAPRICAAAPCPPRCSPLRDVLDLLTPAPDSMLQITPCCNRETSGWALNHSTPNARFFGSKFSFQKFNDKPMGPVPIGTTGCRNTAGFCGSIPVAVARVACPSVVPR